MAEPQDKPDGENRLNPALKKTHDSTHDVGTTPPPLETVSTKENQGEGWPVIWLIVAAICVAVTLYLAL